MNVEIICIGKLKEKYWRDAIAEYAKRLGRFCSFSVTELKEARLPANASPAEEEAVKEAEGRAVIEAIREHSYVIALDVQGKQYDSVSFAGLLEEHMNYGTARIVFVIGGSLGLSWDVLQRADLRLSFSKMTCPPSVDAGDSVRTDLSLF